MCYFDRVISWQIRYFYDADTLSTVNSDTMVIKMWYASSDPGGRYLQFYKVISYNM